MPLREISNNSRRLSQGKKVDHKCQKQTTRVHPKPLPLKASALTNQSSQVTDKAPVVWPDLVYQPPLETENKEVNAAEKENETNKVFIPSNTFLHSVNEWCMFVSKDTECWSTSPHFKQEATCSLCLLCGKTVRGPQMNENLVQKHVKGSHHKKTFQLMENLKKLKEEDAVRFHELIKTVTESELLPASNCTLKQLLAYYHNVTIQGLQSKKALDGIAAHFKRRFLSDKIQSEDGTQKQGTDMTESKTPEEEHKSTRTKDTTIVAEPSHEVNGTNVNADENVGNEENEFGMVFRSPAPKAKETHQRQPIDTPFVGNPTKAVDATETEDSLPAETSLLSTEDDDDADEKGVCESPSSDISEQSELNWMGTITEFDDMLDNIHNIFDGSLDQDLQKMIDDDNAGDICMMGMPMIPEMPMMVVTPLDNLEEGFEFLETKIATFCQATSGAVGQTLEANLTDPNESYGFANDTTVSATSFHTSPSEAVLSGDSSPALIKGTVGVACVQTQPTKERHLEIKRSLRCIAALAFVDV